MTDYTPEYWIWSHIGNGALKLVTAQHGSKVVLIARNSELWTRNLNGILKPLTEDHPHAQLIASAPRTKEERDESVRLLRELLWLSKQMQRGGGVSGTKHDAILKATEELIERIDRE